MRVQSTASETAFQRNGEWGKAHSEQSRRSEAERKAHQSHRPMLRPEANFDMPLPVLGTEPQKARAQQALRAMSERTENTARRWLRRE